MSWWPFWMSWLSLAKQSTPKWPWGPGRSVGLPCSSFIPGTAGILCQGFVLLPKGRRFQTAPCQVLHALEEGLGFSRNLRRPSRAHGMDGKSVALWMLLGTQHPAASMASFLRTMDVVAQQHLEGYRCSFSLALTLCLTERGWSWYVQVVTLQIPATIHFVIWPTWFCWFFVLFCFVFYKFTQHFKL